MLVAVVCLARSWVRAYRGEAEWVDFDTESGDVLLLELARQMALDEGGLQIRLCQLLLASISLEGQLCSPIQQTHS